MSTPVGNVGALPLFKSERDVPAWVVVRRVPFVMPDARGLGVYAAAPEADGLGGWLSSLVRIGGLVAAPFTGGLSIPGAAAVGQALDARDAQSQQAKQIGAGFDQEAGKLTQLFNSIQSKSVITAADYATAANGYNQLAAIASQYSSNSFVARKWADPSYDAAYKARLDQIRTAAQATAGGGSSPADGPGADGSTLGLQVGATVSDNTKLLIGAAAVALLIMFATR